MKEYLSYWVIKKLFDHLFSVVKKPNESIKEYIQCFKIKKAKIVSCDEIVVWKTFK